MTDAATTPGAADLRLRGVTAAAADLRLSKLRGVDYFFANAAADFAPMPQPVLAPHENVAVATGMGDALVSGRPRAATAAAHGGRQALLNILRETG